VSRTRVLAFAEDSRKAASVSSPKVAEPAGISGRWFPDKLRVNEPRAQGV